jgi:hypothetical protein
MSFLIYFCVWRHTATFILNTTPQFVETVFVLGNFVHTSNISFSFSSWLHNTSCCGHIVLVSCQYLSRSIRLLSLWGNFFHITFPWVSPPTPKPTHTPPSQPTVHRTSKLNPKYLLSEIWQPSFLQNYNSGARCCHTGRRRLDWQTGHAHLCLKCVRTRHEIKLHIKLCRTLSQIALHQSCNVSSRWA